MNRIPLTGADNARDLGGYIPASARKIRPRKLLRSNQLSALTVQDRNLLHEEYHVEVIIDLRTHREIQEKPDVEIENAQWVHIPIFQEQLLGITHESAQPDILRGIPDLTALYRKMVSEPACVEQLKQVFRILAVKRDGAVLWHCTEGKDRCGIVSALLLFALGFEEPQVLEDYLYTNQASQKRAEMYYQKVLEHTADGDLADKIRRLFLADAQYLHAAVQEMRHRSGSIQHFLKQDLEINPEQFQQIYLEEA